MLEAKACQVEAWVDRGRDASTGWFVPACNFGANIEWQAGFARTREAGEARFSEAYFQAKTLLREMRDDSPWGVGLVLGVTKRSRQETHRGWDNPYAIVPFSVAIDGTPLTFHANAGWSRDREQQRDATLWGVAMEAAITERLTFVAEAFGENSDKPFIRAGGRWNVIKDRLDIDLTYVTRPGGAREDRYASLGLTWQSGAFLP